MNVLEMLDFTSLDDGTQFKIYDRTREQISQISLDKLEHGIMERVALIIYEETMTALAENSGPCEECGMEAETPVSDPVRKWLFCAEDEQGQTHRIYDWYYIGTYRDATDYAETKCDEFEEKVGGMILKLTIESHGRVE